MSLPTMHRFIRIPAGVQPQVKEVFNILCPGTAVDMFNSGFNATGLGPATHYISSGLVDPQLATALAQGPAAVFALYQANGGIKYTLPQVTTFLAGLENRLDAMGAEGTVLGLLGMKPTAG